MSTNKEWSTIIDDRIEEEGGKQHHIDVLNTEVEVFASRLEPHGMGHLHTTIHVLKHRIVELENELKEYRD